ncbi:putative oxidoreductase YteT isoform X1 [Branchiostoma floridae x Branchiostoma belcheri]
MAPVRALIIGAGNRGQLYARFSLDSSERFQVVGVANPGLVRRQRVQQEFNIPEENVFTDWQKAAEREKFADCVVIATPDHLHKASAVAFADRGYHILLEKPMALTVEDCREVVAACERNNVILSVGHILRYSPPVRKIKELIDSGAIRDIVHIQHMEPVGFWHFAHGFVRGLWRNTAGSSFSLLTKSCHDVDLICYWLSGSRCVRVSSFGSLMHFGPENKPAGAGSRCVDCQVENTCPYSAKKIYLERVKQGLTDFPVSQVCPQEPVDVENLTEALRTGPYGRCVYECDNDVVSNQVVNFQFDGGQTVSFDMVGFTQEVCERQTRISGTKGELRWSSPGPVYVYDFLNQTSTEHPCAAAPPNKMREMHGGDYFLMDAFVTAVETGDRSCVLTGPQETLQSHLLVFAAEQARLQDRVITINHDGSYN